MVGIEADRGLPTGRTPRLSRVVSDRVGGEGRDRELRLFRCEVLLDTWWSSWPTKPRRPLRRRVGGGVVIGTADRGVTARPTDPSRAGVDGMKERNTALA